MPAGPSTQNLDRLPEPGRLRELTATIALLDEILCEDWEGRYYSFDPAWAADAAVASMRDGCGNQWFLWFGEPGLVLFGFDHEASPMTPHARADRSLWPGLLDGYPDALRPALAEPAFEADSITFAIWRTAGDARYRIGNVDFPARQDPDGSAGLLSILDDAPATYARWARDYYETTVDLASVKKLYRRAPLDRKTVEKLNEEADYDAIVESARAMLYPVER